MSLPDRLAELIAKAKADYPDLKVTLAALEALSPARPDGKLTDSDRELVAEVERYENSGDQAGAERLLGELRHCVALITGDLDYIRERERQTGRRYIGSVGPASRARPHRARPHGPAIVRRGSRARGAGRPARRRTSRSSSRAGPSDLDPPPRSPAALEGVAG
jgi:hypothetical protein